MVKLTCCIGHAAWISPSNLTEKLNWCTGRLTSPHVASISPANLEVELKWSKGNAASGHMTSMFSLNLEGKLNYGIGNVPSVFQLNLSGKLNWYLDYVMPISHYTFSGKCKRRQNFKILGRCTLASTSCFYKSGHEYLTINKLNAKPAVEQKILM